MKKKARSYSVDFKLDAVSRMDHCKTIAGLAKELGIQRKFLYRNPGDKRVVLRSMSPMICTVLGKRRLGCYTFI
jgi:hypothetical protein